MKKRLLYIDILNCLAIFGVLVQHTAQIAHKGTPGETWTVIGAILQTLFLPAVGIFFMNSGAMLLDYRNREDTRVFFKKRFAKVLVPFVFWSVVYYIYSRFYYAFPGVVHRNSMSLHDFGQSFIDNNINVLFWFFYVIIQLYIATPVFSVVAQYNKKMLAYTAYIGMICTVLIPYLGSLKGFNVSSSNIYEPLLAGSWMVNFALGYLIKINYFSRKTENYFIVAGLITLVVNLFNDILVWKIHWLNNLNILFYTVAVYLLVKRFSNKLSDTKIISVFANMSSASFGIYILHPFMLQSLDWIAFKGTPRNWSYYLEILKNPVHIFVWPFVIYGLLLVIVIGLKKLKVFKYILP